MENQEDTTKKLYKTIELCLEVIGQFGDHLNYLESVLKKNSIPFEVADNSGLENLLKKAIELGISDFSNDDLKDITHVVSKDEIKNISNKLIDGRTDKEINLFEIQNSN